MAKSVKTNQSLTHKKFSIKTLLIFAVIFGAVGGWVIVRSFAASNTTSTILRTGVARITATSGSSGYSIVNDTFNFDTVSVARISPNGTLSLGGKGGGTTATATAKQRCYVLRVDPGTTAEVRLVGVNGGTVFRTLKAWPYDAAPVPYQYECVVNGTIQNKNVPDIWVHRGGPVYFYEMQDIYTYPY